MRSHSTRRKMMMIYFKRRVSSFADSLKLLYCFIPESNRKSPLKHISFNDAKIKTRQVAFNATKDDDDILQKRVSSFADSVKSLYRFIPESNCKAPNRSCCMPPKLRHLRSHSTRREMMIIYFKRRVSSFGDSLKSLYRFIPESNRKSPLKHIIFNAAKIKTRQVAFNATKDDENLLQKKSVIFC